MYKGQYDSDVTLWSPEGRLHQLEYACSAVDQGSVVLGLRNKKFAVLVGLKRAPSKLAMHQEKIFKIDSHVGIGVSGLISDGRRLQKYMIRECLNYKYVYGKDMSVLRLVVDISDKQQVQTQISSGRPYGVGLLVMGYDAKSGAHLFNTDPSGNYFEYVAHAIGARNQAAKTYLEKHFDSFEECTLEQLIQHGVNALKETIKTKETALTIDNTSVMIVGEGTKLRPVVDDELSEYVARAEGEDVEDAEEATEASASAAADTAAPSTTTMEVDG
jgi:20S proteasome subunit alpha 6